MTRIGMFKAILLFFIALAISLLFEVYVFTSIAPDAYYSPFAPKEYSFYWYDSAYYPYPEPFVKSYGLWVIKHLGISLFTSWAIAQLVSSRYSKWTGGKKLCFSLGFGALFAALEDIGYKGLFYCIKGCEEAILPRFPFTFAYFALIGSVLFWFLLTLYRRVGIRIVFVAFVVSFPVIVYMTGTSFYQYRLNERLQLFNQHHNSVLNQKVREYRGLYLSKLYSPEFRDLPYSAINAYNTGELKIRAAIVGENIDELEWAKVCADWQRVSLGLQVFGANIANYCWHLRAIHFNNKDWCSFIPYAKGTFGSHENMVNSLNERLANPCIEDFEDYSQYGHLFPNPPE